MRQSWFGFLSPEAGSRAAAVLALLLATANAPAQSRDDSSRDNSDSSSASDASSSRADQSSAQDRSDPSSRAANARSSRSSQAGRGAQAGRQAHHPALGVTFYNDESNPLEIRRVLPGSPAEQAGLERRDEILSVNGRRVSSVQQLKQQIDRAGQDGELELGILRDGRQETVQATLSSGRQTFAGGNRGRGQRQWNESRSGRNGADDEYQNQGYQGARNQNYGNQGNRQGSRNQGYARGSRDADNGQDETESSNRYAEGYRGGMRSNDRAFLGVTLDQNQRGGVRVSNIYPNSPAQQAGLRAGDEIVAIDDDDVQSNQDVMQLLSQKDPDDEVAIEVERNGRQRTLHATLISQQEFSSSSNRSYRTGRRNTYAQNSDDQGGDSGNRGSRRSQQGQNGNEDDDNF